MITILINSGIGGSLYAADETFSDLFNGETYALETEKVKNGLFKSLHGKTAIDELVDPLTFNVADFIIAKDITLEYLDECLLYLTPKTVLLEEKRQALTNGRLEHLMRCLSGKGYAVDFEVLNSKYFHNAQNREILYVVATNDRDKREAWRDVNGRTTVSKTKRKFMDHTEIHSFNFDYPTQDKITKKLRHILEDSVDADHYIDLPLIKHVANADMKQLGYIGEGNRRGYRVYSKHGVGGMLVKNSGGIDRCGSGLVYDDVGVRKLTALECVRLQGYPNKVYTVMKKAGINDNSIARLISDESNVSVMKAILAKIKETII